MTISPISNPPITIPTSGDPVVLSYDSNRGRYLFKSSIEYASTARSAGFQWDQKEMVWWTSDVFCAIKLLAYSDEPTKAELYAKWFKANESLKLSYSAEAKSDMHIPCPRGYEYRPYQTTGIEYMTGRPATLLADEMGLGKTIQIIGLINALSAPTIDGSYNPNRINNALIVTPASLKLNWLAELKRWLISKLTYGIADARWFPRNHDIVIINYDILHKWQDQLLAREWDLIAGDEIHYVKNPDARRSTNFFTLRGKIRVGASGTPLPNMPKELFYVLNWLDPVNYPKFMPYAIRYCGAAKLGSSWSYTGGTNLDELQTRLRSTIMIRRFKKDVEKDLPPKIRQIIELPAPRGITNILKQEVDEYEAREGVLKALKERIDAARTANDTDSYAAAVNNFKQEQQRIVADLSKLRKMVANAKLPFVIEHLKDMILDGQKVVVFAHHHEIMDQLVDAFGKQAVKFSGKENLQQRDQAVRSFQDDPNIMIFVGSITAAGVGITLTASSRVVFAELDWVPGNLSQCEDRCHRIGQRDSVLVQHLVLEGSLDVRIAHRLVDKQRMIDETLN